MAWNGRKHSFESSGMILISFIFFLLPSFTVTVSGGGGYDDNPLEEGPLTLKFHDIDPLPQERTGCTRSCNDHYYENVLPDLSVWEIDFSRSPVLHGQDVEVRVTIKNFGKTHAKNVDIKIYDDEDIIGDQSIDIVKAYGEELVFVNESFIVEMADPLKPYENHYIMVIVNKQRAINEGYANYQNNEKKELLVVVNPNHNNSLDKTSVTDLGDYIPFPLYLLSTILIILLGALAIVVHSPDDFFLPPSNPLHHLENEAIPVPLGNRKKTTSCQHCGKMVELWTEQYTIRFFCPYCGHDSVTDRFR